MHYYQFNIGDYASHTARLSPMEDLAYRRMLDLYYLNERPLNGCSADVAREIGLADFSSDVEYILNKFFTKVDDTFTQKRVDNEIAAYQKKRKQAAKAGRASAKARQRTFNGRSTDAQQDDNDRATKHKPLTNNHKPLTSSTPAKPKYEDCDLDFAQKAFEEILKQSPEHKKPNLETWAKDVRLMREKDSRSLDDMARVWVWIRNDHFWSANILSMSKFREKYDQIKLKITSEVKPNENTGRLDNSAAGRVRANVQRELDEIEQQLSRQSEGGQALAIDDQSVWSPMD